MVIKQEKDETYESWADRARIFEHNIAIKRIAKGDDIHIVLDQMSNKLMQKLLNPIYSALKTSNSTYDNIVSRAEYKRIYLDKNKPNADQVDGEIFDKLD
jgi:hypothetical protein